jgi:hypothetical protein
MATPEDNSSADFKYIHEDIDESEPKLGRKKIPFDEGLFKRLCQIQCTKTEICSVMDISMDTLERRVRESFNMGCKEARLHFSGKGKAKLRGLQFKQAEESATMSIWLGKQYLGQSDKVSHSAHNELEAVTDEELEQLEREIKESLASTEVIDIKQIESLDQHDEPTQKTATATATQSTAGEE